MTHNRSPGKGQRPRSISPGKGRMPSKKIPVRSTNAFTDDVPVHYIGEGEDDDDRQDALAGYTDEECDQIVDYLSEHDAESGADECRQEGDTSRT